ncbi:MAG: DUF4062 domain-containing protein [Prevotella sp.]|nr:DUF4062 domain-containing protein [Prevotella sp.]
MTKVFISSVQKEFAQERAALCKYIREDVLLCKFFQPFLFEELPAIDLTAQDAYLNEAAQSEIYLGLYGKDYGYEDAEGVSPTEREFDTATEHNRHRLIFVKRCSERHPKETTFIRKVENQLVRKSFEDFESLKSAVYASLVRYLEDKEYLRILPWDATYNHEATLDEIDSSKVEKFVLLAQDKRNFPLKIADGVPKILQHLNLMSDDGRLTNAALLLFGKRPQHFFPTSEIKCAQFYGYTVQKPVPFYQVFRGGFFELVDQAVGFVMSHIDAAVGTRNQSAQVDIDYELPVEAVTEAIVNACVHRAYNNNGSVQVMLFRDRLEIWSPGSLPYGMTAEKITQTHRSLPVNPILAHPVYLAGYIERLGTGTVDMIEKCEAKGLKTPEFHFDEEGRVIIWRKDVTPNVTPNKIESETVGKDDSGDKTQNVTPNVTPNVTLTKTEIRIKNELTEILSNKYITADELATKFNVTERTIRRDFKLLRKSYDIEWIPLSPTSGYWKIEKK